MTQDLLLLSINLVILESEVVTKVVSWNWRPFAPSPVFRLMVRPGCTSEYSPTVYVNADICADTLLFGPPSWVA